MFWSEMALSLKLNGFEDGLNHRIDQLTYEIVQEYREGVDLAHQLQEPPMWGIDEPLDAVAAQFINRSRESDRVA